MRVDVAAVRERLDPRVSRAGTPSRSGRRLVLRALGRHRGRLLAGLGLLCAWQASEAAVPILVGLVIDHAIATPSWRAIAVGLIAVAVLFTVLSLAYRFGARLANRALNIETHQLRVEVAEHALNPRGLRTDLMPGEILSIATADADNTAFLFRRIALAGSAAVGVLIGAGYLLITDWVVGLVVLIGLPVTLAIAQLVAPVVGRRMERQQQQIAVASGMATDLMTGVRVIKGIGGAATAAARYRRASQQARGASVRTAGGMALIDGLQQTLVGLLVAGVVIAAGWRVIIGEVSVGELVAMVGLAVFLAEPVGTVVAITAMIAQSLASARRIADFHATPTVVPDGDRAADPDAPAMELSDFAVDPLPATDLAIHHGELVAAVIADARVAERLVAALAGESEAYTGTIRIGGVPRPELSVDAAHRAILVPPHDVDLFAGTIGSNVRLRAAESDVEPALRAAAVTELIELMPDGLEHPVDAAGSNLSGGQRQRIALARALATAPPLLVLPEPTTAVDAVTEAGIAGAVKQLRAQRATLVISTSPAFLAVADRVVYLTEDDGVRVGRHDDLMRVAGYRELVAR